MGYKKPKVNIIDNCIQSPKNRAITETEFLGALVKPDQSDEVKKL